MATKKFRKPDTLRAQIAALKDELVAAEDAEKQQAADELIRLVRRAKCMPEALRFVRQRLSATEASDAHKG